MERFVARYRNSSTGSGTLGCDFEETDLIGPEVTGQSIGQSAATAPDHVLLDVFGNHRRGAPLGGALLRVVQFVRAELGLHVAAPGDDQFALIAWRQAGGGEVQPLIRLDVILMNAVADEI